MSGSYKTLDQMVTEAANTVKDTSTSSKARLKETIQRAYMEYAAMYPWPDLIEIENDAVSLTAGQKSFYLPYRYGNLLGIFPSNQSIPLERIEIAAYLRRHGKLDDLASTGWMSSFVKVGDYGQKSDITTAEKLVFTPGTEDNNANGAVTINCVVQGLVNNDDFTEEVVITNGVAQTSAKSFSVIYSVSTDGNQTVPMFVSGADSVTIYARIPSGVRSVRYTKYRVGDAPGEAKDLTVIFKRDPIPLHKDHQTPVIPVSDALVKTAVGERWMSDRKFQGIGATYLQQAQTLAQRTFDEQTVQTDSSPQAMPIERYQFMTGLRKY